MGGQRWSDILSALNEYIKAAKIEGQATVVAFDSVDGRTRLEKLEFPTLKPSLKAGFIQRDWLARRCAALICRASLYDQQLLNAPVSYATAIEL